MRLAYLLVAFPALIVGILYLALFHNLGLQIRPAPFLGTVGLFAAAVLAVRYFQRRKVRTPRNSHGHH